MPQIRVELSKPTHHQLKIIAVGLDTTLSRVIIRACEQYVGLLGVQVPGKKLKKKIPT